MVRQAFLLVFLFGFFHLEPTFSQSGTDGNSCQYFYAKLQEIPHTKLVQNSIIDESILYGKKKKGCEVEFVTNDSLISDIPNPAIPSFLPGQTASLYENGWRRDINYDAEAPGSRMFGIKKKDSLCLISQSQPATLVKSGKIVSSKKITVIIQCSKDK